MNTNAKALSFKMIETLQQGKNRLCSDAQKRTVSFIQSQMTENDAFIDKNGNEDLYYTSFGLMLAYVFKLHTNITSTERWLNQQNEKESDLVYLSASMRCRMLCKLLTKGKLYFTLSQLFHKKQKLPDITAYPHGDNCSPYAQFLLLSLQEALGIDTAKHHDLWKSLSLYRVNSGGYSNVKEHKTASTNATVAALAVQGQLCGYEINSDVDYLYSSQDESGGFYANPSAPLPDLLSTATALFMLQCYGVTPRFHADDFIDAHWMPSGGFCATLLDEHCDIEYTFYGLLALGSIGHF